jgi:hypothetical protein
MTRFLIGMLLGGFLTSGILAFAQESSYTVKNGTLDGWAVVRDDETLLCEDPTVFIRARQIQCP